MPRSPARITRVLFSLAVTAGLAFGAQSAFATSAQASSCPYYPPNGAFGLSCTVGPAGDAYCDQQCKSIVGSWSFGHCNRPEGCRVCAV